MGDGSKMVEKKIAALKGIGKKTVEAGWFESDRYSAGKGSSEGVPVAKIARINEFGATIHRGDKVITIPARPFMRLAWSNFSNDRRQIQAKIAKKMADKKITAAQGLGQIGLALEGYIAKSIKDGSWQPNAASTVKKKGFDKPLIWSGHMFKTVNSKVK